MKPIYITENCIIYNDMEWGWVNGKTQPRWHLSLYDRWRDMWSRCRNPANKFYENYKDCPIDDRYHFLSEYVHDIQLLKDFDLLEANPFKYDIDKDKIEPNNRCYYFEHLSIVTKEENRRERINRRGNPNPPKALKGTHIKNESIIYFESLYEAEKNGFNRGGIHNCIKGVRKSYKGYKWEFVEKEGN